MMLRKRSKAELYFLATSSLLRSAKSYTGDSPDSTTRSAPSVNLGQSPFGFLESQNGLFQKISPYPFS